MEPGLQYPMHVACLSVCVVFYRVPSEPYYYARNLWFRVCWKWQIYSIFCLRRVQIVWFWSWLLGLHCTRYLIVFVNKIEPGLHKIRCISLVWVLFLVLSRTNHISIEILVVLLLEYESILSPSRLFYRRRPCRCVWLRYATWNHRYHLADDNFAEKIRTTIYIAAILTWNFQFCITNLLLPQLIYLFSL